MLLVSCTVTLTDLSCILVYMRRVMRKMGLDKNTTGSVLVLCEMDCYSMLLPWYGFLFYAVMMSNNNNNNNIVVDPW